MGSERSVSSGHGTQGDQLEAMARELAALRAKVQELETRAWPGTRRRVRAGSASEPARGSERASGTQPGAANRYPVSRRRLFGLLGGAAAAGAGLAVASSITGASSASADGPNVLLGNGTGGTTNSAGTVATSITSTASSATFQAVNTANNPQLSLTPAPATIGAPMGLHKAGDVFVDFNGTAWYATADGNPATWVPLSLPPIFVPTLPAPARVYDSRPGDVPLGCQKGALQPGEERVIDLSGSPHGTLDLTGAYAALVNLTVVDTTGGGYVTLFAADATVPDTSNINFAGGWIIANNATTLFELATGNIKAHVGGAATDVVIDVMGLYLG
jgi:hypothetical protein